MSIRLAVKRARDSKFERARVGAVIVSGGRILDSSCNSIRGSKALKKRIPESLHAEQAVILKMLKSNRLHLIAGSTIYVARVLNNATTAISKPCEECENLLRAFGVKRVIYTTGNSRRPISEDRY